MFSKQKYKRNPDPKIEKLSPVWGLRHHILLTTNSQPTPKNNDYEPTKDPICYNKSVPFGLFCFKKIRKTPTTHSPKKTFSHQLFSGNLVPKGRKAISAGSSAKGTEPAVNPRAGLVGFPSLWLVNLCQPIYPPPKATLSRNKGSIWHYYGKPMVDNPLIRPWRVR